MAKRSGQFTHEQGYDALAEPLGTGQEPPVAEGLEDEVASMELNCHPQEGEDPEEAGNVLVASHEQDGGAQGAPPIQPEGHEEGYPDQALAQAAGAAVGDLLVDAPGGTTRDPGYAPEMSGASSAASSASPHPCLRPPPCPPPPVQAGWMEAVTHPPLQCLPHQRITLLPPLLYRLMQVRPAKCS